MKYAFVAALSILTGSATAQEAVDSTQRALTIISDFANSMCANPAYKGSTVTVGAEANIAADISKLLKNIANVSLQLGANVKRESFDGLAQKDLLEATKNATDCRLTVFKSLEGRLLSAPRPPASPPRQQDRTPGQASVPKSSLPFDVASLSVSKRKTVLAARGQIERAEAAATLAREAEQAAERAAANAQRNDPLTHVFKGTGIRYEGEWVDGRPSGFGKVLWFGSDSASLGERFAGQMNGWIRVRGVFSYPPPVARQHPYGGALRYEGEWAPTARNKAGNWNGHGTVLYRDGSSYRGQLVDGDFDGYGTLFRPDTSRIEGRWKESLPVSGESVQWSANGVIVN